MSTEFAATAILALTFVLVAVVDRGVPNTLESIAFGIESAAEWTVTGLRRNAARLRERHRRIELEHQRRMTAKTGTTEPAEQVSSRPFSAAA
jgi:hypothetical protein